jgi:hypothetical protein
MAWTFPALWSNTDGEDVNVDALRNLAMSVACDCALCPMNQRNTCSNPAMIRITRDGRCYFADKTMMEYYAMAREKTSEQTDKTDGTPL